MDPAPKKRFWSKHKKQSHNRGLRFNWYGAQFLRNTKHIKNWFAENYKCINRHSTWSIYQHIIKKIKETKS